MKLEKQEKMIIKVHKLSPITGNVVRITDEAMHRIIELQKETGLSARHIISEMILFSADRVEVVEI